MTTLPEALGDDAAPAGTRTRPQVSKRRSSHRHNHRHRHRPCRSGADAAGADAAGEEEATVRLGRLQHHRRKPSIKMARNPHEEEGADARAAEGPGFRGAWPLADASLADS
jgi:hypothetical protein